MKNKLSSNSQWWDSQANCLVTVKTEVSNTAFLPSGNQVCKNKELLDWFMCLKVKVNSKVVWMLSSFLLALMSAWFPGRLLQLIQEIIASCLSPKRLRQLFLVKSICVSFHFSYFVPHCLIGSHFFIHSIALYVALQCKGPVALVYVLSAVQKLQVSF